MPRQELIFFKLRQPQQQQQPQPQPQTQQQAQQQQQSINQSDKQQGKVSAGNLHH